MRYLAGPLFAAFAVWAALRPAVAQQLFPPGARPLLPVVVSPLLVLVGGLAMRFLPRVNRARRRRRILGALLLVTCALASTLAAYLRFVERMPYGREGEIAAVVVSWQREPDCGCGDAPTRTCIEGLGIANSTAIAECWGENRVSFVKLLLTFSYLLLLGGLGTLSGSLATFRPPVSTGRSSGLPGGPPSERLSGISVFLSYRRRDSAAIADRIHEHLSARLGPEHLFKDVVSIDHGDDYRSRIRDAIERSDALLAILGPDWATASDESGNRRLDDPTDLVRVEIETALRGGLFVIPVLVNGASIPSPDSLPPPLRALAQRHAARVRNDPDFRQDLDRLVASLGTLAQ